MDTRTKEAVRYLGYGNHAVDGQTLELIRDSFEELDRVADKRIIYCFDVNVTETKAGYRQITITMQKFIKDLCG